MHVSGAVAVGDPHVAVSAEALLEDGDPRRRVLRVVVPREVGSRQREDDVAVESRLDHLAGPEIRQPQELATSLLDERQAVRSRVALAPRSGECAVGAEDEDRGIRDVKDDDVAVARHDDAVGATILPRRRGVRDDRPVVDPLEGVLALPDDHRGGLGAGCAHVSHSRRRSAPWLLARSNSRQGASCVKSRGVPRAGADSLAEPTENPHVVEQMRESRGRRRLSGESGVARL